jgi:hypothetical protein
MASFYASGIYRELRNPIRSLQLWRQPSRLNRWLSGVRFWLRPGELLYFFGPPRSGNPGLRTVPQWLLLAAIAGKPVLELLQVDFAPVKTYALSFEQEALFQGGFATQRDASAGAENALPRQAPDLPQDAPHVTGAARVSGSLGDGSVGAHTTAWDAADGGGDRAG